MNSDHSYLPISDVIKSVSVTHKFHKPKLIFLNTSDVEEGKIIHKKYFKVSDLKGQAKKTIRKDDILFSEIRPKNKRYAYVDIDDTDDYVVSTKLMVLRKFNNKVDNKYVYYFLTNEKMLSVLQNRAENRIGSFPQITFDLLSEYHIRVPELGDQQKISGLLSDLDLKIELNNKINAELETLARMIYDYWFVQFDFPNADGKPYKSSGGKMVWNKELNRAIPEGWEVKKIGDVLSCLESGRRDKGGSVSSGIPSIGAESIDGLGEYDYSDEKFISKVLFTSLKSGKLQSKDVVLYKDGAYIGRNTIFMDGFPYEECAVNEHVFILRTNKILPSQFYLYLWLQIPEIMLFMKRVGLRAAQPGLNQSDINNAPIQLPNAKLLEDFNEYIEQIMSLIFMNAKEGKKLAALRDWLLPMLMNGQVKVAA